MMSACFHVRSPLAISKQSLVTLGQQMVFDNLQETAYTLLSRETEQGDHGTPFWMGCETLDSATSLARTGGLGFSPLSSTLSVYRRMRLNDFTGLRTAS